MILATPTDRPAIEAFLLRHRAIAMFPLSNLARYGMEGGHGRAMRFWVKWQAGQITDVLSLTEEGAVFPTCPTGPWGDVAVVMAGVSIRGVIGDAEQVAACRSALGLAEDAPLDVTEPHYSLPLDALVSPDTSGFTLRPLQDADIDLIVFWRASFCVESLSVATQNAMPRAIREVQSYLDQDSHRVLFKDDQPVAMTGFNAVMPQVVQVGGVFTPPALRSRGYARVAVALHLTQALANGVVDAVLSAASIPAARAYEAIGFRGCGDFRVVAYETPQVIHG